MQQFLISTFLIGSLMLFFQTEVEAQCQFDPETGTYVVSGTNNPCPNPVLTAVPFLTITPDARSGGMGDIGVALDGTPNSLHHNGSALAFTEKEFGISATYTPWLRGIVGDVYLAYLSTYYKPDDVQAVGLSLKYFSLGEIQFTDANAAPIGTGLPREWSLGLTYARKLTDQFSMSVAGKFIYSNLAGGQTIGTIEINAATSIAADIGMQYVVPVRDNEELTLGLAITNFGTKVSYTESVFRDFIPTNLSIGAAYKWQLDEYNSLTLAAQANKLLVPTPAIYGTDSMTIQEFDENGNGIPDFREKGLFSGVFGSFTDAPNGFSEELREVTWSLGVEYWYQEQFGVRMGYFNEHVTKGNRKYLTFGFGLKYNAFGIDMSYLVSTSAQRNPLANTLRFSLLLDMGVFTGES
jgi:hypothetical protein